ncbi:MAG TPA: HAMP domain-containing sensor histidine kinase [Casimicrobiaceae bacterium]|nr:HAMP domain-containing sensor histidine kinase [Casimicrobiaceae bacterium]
MNAIPLVSAIAATTSLLFTLSRRNDSELDRSHARTTAETVAHTRRSTARHKRRRLNRMRAQGSRACVAARSGAVFVSRVGHAARQRDEFLAVLAHELRNPLAPIRNSVQILQKAPTDVERVRRATRTIDRQTSLLVRLIDDLLDVARISQGLVGLKIVPRTVVALVTAGLEAARASAEATVPPIVVEHADPAAAVMVDPLRAEQIVANLVSNAIDHSPPGTRILVRTLTNDTLATIEVIDQGYGIAQHALSEIFTMFARPDVGSRRRLRGLGVGLAFAKQLAEQMGGSISAASAGRGEGATFTVCLPLVRAGAPSGTDRPPGSSAPTPSHRETSRDVDDASS